MFELLTNSGMDKFVFYNSPNPSFLPSDWQAVERLCNEWCLKMNKVSIQDLQRIWMNNKKSHFEKATFTGQIIEIRHLSQRKMVVRYTVINKSSDD